MKAKCMQTFPHHVVFFLSSFPFFLPITEWCGDAQRGVKVQPASPPSPPSPMTTRSGMTLKRLQGSGPRTRRSTAVPGEQIVSSCQQKECPRFKYHAANCSCDASSPPRHFTSAVKQEFHLEEDKYYTEDEYVEEEEEDDEDEDEDSSAEKGSKKKGRGRGNAEPRMKMRRIFRITHGRERQRGGSFTQSRILCSTQYYITVLHHFIPLNFQTATTLSL